MFTSNIMEAMYSGGSRRSENPIKILPLWSTSIFLSTTIAMFSSLVILQALTMDRNLGPTFKIPAGSFLVFNLVATIITIFIIDRCILPIWQNLTHQSLTPLQCLGIGHVINIIAMVGSALIERRRLQIVRIHHLMSKPSSVVPMSGQLAFYYQEFPRSLRSTSTAMTSLIIGMGFYLSTALTDLVHRSTRWLPDNLNDGSLDNVYWMLAVIGVVNFAYSLICAKLFKYQNVENLDDEASGPVL
ncbi:conserved hypothetical protein [Ricinus communis]|uniref:Uncharacterized protein n=1 Tax=Ricinus communis TaxID=3988 RepID=B9SD46_RICCO|nr:conserved hypothetical protein [Ricinus communis]